MITSWTSALWGAVVSTSITSGLFALYSLAAGL